MTSSRTEESLAKQSNVWMCEWMFSSWWCAVCVCACVSCWLQDWEMPEGMTNISKKYMTYKHRCACVCVRGGYWSEQHSAWSKRPERWTGAEMDIMKEEEKKNVSFHISSLAVGGPLLTTVSQQRALTNHLKIDGAPFSDIVHSRLPPEPRGRKCNLWIHQSRSEEEEDCILGNFFNEWEEGGMKQVRLLSEQHTEQMCVSRERFSNERN